MIRYEEKGAGRLVAVFEWLEPRAQWRWFAGIVGGCFLLLWAMGGWKAAGAMAALLLYPVAAQCFNRTVVEVDRERIRWRERPFAWRRERCIEVGAVNAWVFGPTPRGSSEYKLPMAVYSVGVERKDGKILQVIRGEGAEAEVLLCAQRCAKASGLKAEKRGAMRSAVNDREDLRRLAAILGAFLALVSLIVFLSGGTTEGPGR
jgi:hypothetical protein